ncbi:hypothetical protein ACXZ65_28960 [Streptomyces aculeolatus]
MRKESTQFLARAGRGAPIPGRSLDVSAGGRLFCRHFPTRQALIAAVYDDPLCRLRAAAEGTRTNQPAFEALTTWLRLVVDHINRLLSLILEDVQR